MLYLNENIIVHLTKYMNISEYKNMISISKYFYDTVKKYENIFLINLLNNKEGYDFSIFNEYQRIRITKKNNSLCYTIPKNMSIKTILKDIFSKDQNIRKDLSL